MYSAVGEDRMEFNLLHKEDMSPVRYAKICRLDGRELSKDDIVRGFEYADGEYVVITDDDFRNASPKLTKAIEIVDFVDEGEIDSILFEKPYYLEPDKGASRAYALLREALSKAKKVGIGRFVLREREHLAAVRKMGTLLVLNQLRFMAEIRSPESLSLPEETEPDAREMELAMALIDKMTERFKPDEYRDTYADSLASLIREKIEGRESVPKGEAPQPTSVVDLMAVLKQSLEIERKEAA
jgi:DNA end-binding protein Ku